MHNSTENEFRALCFSGGLLVNDFPDKKQDIEEHWDIEVTLPLFGRRKIDVKGVKYTHRHGGAPCVWWEWRNVRGGDGWGVPNGLSRVVAQLMPDGVFYMSGVADMALRIKQAVNANGDRRGRGEFEIYQRDGRLDLVTRVPIDFFKKYATPLAFPPTPANLTIEQPAEQSAKH